MKRTSLNPANAAAVPRAEVLQGRRPPPLRRLRLMLPPPSPRTSSRRPSPASGRRRTWWCRSPCSAAGASALECMWALAATGAFFCMMPCARSCSSRRAFSPGVPATRSYKHWRGAGGFYAGLPQRLEFEAYAREFNFVSLASAAQALAWAAERWLRLLRQQTRVLLHGCHLHPHTGGNQCDPLRLVRGQHV